MLENYRHPGEFEPQSDVFMEWIPDAYQMKGYDNSRSCAEIVKALQEFGGVTLHINCGAEGVLERAKSSLAEKGVDTADIRFVQFADPNFYVRDNGPTVMVDDRGGRILINPNWRVIGKKVCPEPNRNPCDKGRLHAGHSIAQQCPSAPPLHLFR